MRQRRDDRRGLFLLLLVTTTLCGCIESVTDTGIEIPYVEEIVVQGYLLEGTRADTLLITRTLPPLETWTIGRAAIADAVVDITVDGAEHRLRSLGNGLYLFEGVEKKPGMTFALRVRIGEKTLTATAMIPVSTPITAVAIDTVANGCGDDFPSLRRYDQIQFSADLTVAENTTYGTYYEWSVSFDSGAKRLRQPGRTRDFYRPEYAGTLFRRVFDRECLDEEVPYAIDTVFVRLYTYEKRYTRFHQTRGDDDADLLFGPGVDDIEWNVTGDGFGFFFGRAVAYDTLVVTS